MTVSLIGGGSSCIQRKLWTVSMSLTSSVTKGYIEYTKPKAWIHGRSFGLNITEAGGLGCVAPRSNQYYTPTLWVGAILQSPCPSVRSHFRNRYLSFYWKKWFYIWYMALAWWLVPCLPFPGLPHIYLQMNEWVYS